MTGERAIDDEGAHAATSSFTGRWLGAFGTRFSDVFDHIFFLPAGRFLAASGRNDMQRATLTAGPVQSGMGAALARLLDHVLPFSTTSFVRGSPARLPFSVLLSHAHATGRGHAARAHEQDASHRKKSVPST